MDKLTYRSATELAEKINDEYFDGEKSTSISRYVVFLGIALKEVATFAKNNKISLDDKLVKDFFVWLATYYCQMTDFKYLPAAIVDRIAIEVAEGVIGIFVDQKSLLSKVGGLKPAEQIKNLENAVKNIAKEKTQLDGDWSAKYEKLKDSLLLKGDELAEASRLLGLADKVSADLRKELADAKASLAAEREAAEGLEAIIEKIRGDAPQNKPVEKTEKITKKPAAGKPKAAKPKKPTKPAPKKEEPTESVKVGKVTMVEKPAEVEVDGLKDENKPEVELVEPPKATKPRAAKKTTKPKKAK